MGIAPFKKIKESLKLFDNKAKRKKRREKTRFFPAKKMNESILDKASAEGHLKVSEKS